MPAPTEEQPEIITRKRHSALNRFRLWRRACRAVRDPDWGRPAIDAFRSGVSGSMPREPAGGIVLGACNDLYYWKFAITLLLSIEQQVEPLTVHLHLCSPSAETLAHVERLSRALSRITLSWTWDDSRLARGLPYRSVYLTSARFLVASWILEATRSPILCLDVDAIAVRPIGPSFDARWAEADVLLIRRPDKKAVTQKILAAAVGLNPTPGGLRFASALARAIAASFDIPPRYHVDQILIHQVMGALQGLVVAQMPATLADYGFSADATIWMPKGWALKNSDLYADAKRRVDEQYPELARP